MADEKIRNRITETESKIQVCDKCKKKNHFKMILNKTAVEETKNKTLTSLNFDRKTIFSNFLSCDAIRVGGIKR